MTTIRPFDACDDAALLPLWARTLYRDPVSPQRFRQMVLLDASFNPEGCLVLEIGGAPAGFGLGLVRREPLEGVGLQPELGWITAFFIAPEYQRQGFGSRLLDQLLDFFRVRGRRQVLVSPYTPHYFFPGVDVEAYASGHRFFEKHGFQETARVVGMSRRILDFAVPEEIASAEARAVAAGTHVRFFQPEYVPALMRFMESNFPGDWTRALRERLQRGVEWDEILIAERNGE